MAGKTTRVTAVIAAKVEGSKDLQQLAGQLDDIPDKTTTEVAAKVTGSKEVNGLVDQLAEVPDSLSTEVSASVRGAADLDQLGADLDQLPRSTDAKVAATVTGDADVSGLHSDLLGLPGSTDAKVAATVTGDAEVSGLHSDLLAIPPSTAAKVDTTVTGSDKIDALVQKLADAPKSTTFTVTAKVAEQGKTVKQLGDDIDKTKGKAKGLGVEGAAFGSQFLGPFSEGIGVFGDMAEQLRNLGGDAEEAGGKFKAVGQIAAGLGIGIAAGLAIDAFTKMLAEGSRIAAEHTSDVQKLVAAYGDIGPAVNKATRAVAFSELTGEAAGRKVLDWAKTNGIAASQVVDAFLDLPAGQDVKGKIEAWNAAGQGASGISKFGASMSSIIGISSGATKALHDSQTEVSNLFGVAADAATGWATQQEAINGTADAADNLGQHLPPATQAMIDASSASTSTAAGYTSVAAGAALMGERLPPVTAALVVSAAAQKEAAAAAADTKAAQDAYAQSMKDQADAAEKAAQASLDAAKAAAQHALDTDGVSTALDDVAKTSNAATRSLNFLGAAIDKLSGRDRTAEQSAADFNDSLMGLGDAAKDVAKEGGLSKKALLQWNVAALTTSKTGQEVYSSLNQLQSSYTEVVDATYEHTAATKGSTAAMADARKAADTARASFVKQATELGLTGKQAAALADKLGILAGKDIPDKTFKLIADDKKANAAVDTLDAKKIDPKTLTVKGDKADAERVLAALKSEPVANKVQKILGSNADAKTKIAELKAIGIPDKTAKVVAKTSGLDQAEADLNAVADGTYNASIDVTLHLTQAQRNLLNFLFPGAVPNASTSGVTTSGVTTSATSSASSAPSVGTHVSATVPVAGNVYRITVNGAIDKDGTARAIAKVLDQRATRIGPTHLGRRQLV